MFRKHFKWNPAHLKGLEMREKKYIFLNPPNSCSLTHDLQTVTQAMALLCSL